MKNKQNISFEESVARLELIIDKINEGNIPLEESLKLYEEADSLIASCDNKINQAEAKIREISSKRAEPIEEVTDEQASYI